MAQFSASPAVTASRTISSFTTGRVPCSERQAPHLADDHHTPRAEGACKCAQHGSGTPLWGGGKRTAIPPQGWALPVHGAEQWAWLVHPAADMGYEFVRVNAQATHRVGEADGADVGVGRRAIAVGAVAERLGVGCELYVRLDADSRQVLHLCNCTGTWPLIAQLACVIL